MKRFRIAFLLAVLMSMAGANSYAYDFEVDGIYYNYNDGSDGASVSVARGNSSGFTNYSYTGDVVIPPSVTYNGKTYSVTAIGYHAFSSCSYVTSVTIPTSVTAIGDNAFGGCGPLNYLVVPSHVTVESGAFSGCRTQITKVVVTDFAAFCNNEIIPELHYAKGGFSIGCRNITLIDEDGEEIKDYVIPDGVTSIGNTAFRGCIGLTSVSIPNSVTSIGSLAFEECSGLAAVTIPNSVTTIESCAFYWCSGLTSVTIGSGVTSIGNYAFGNDENIVTVNSLIEEPFAIEGKSSSRSVFHGDTYIYGKLKVPFGTIDKYKATKGWRDFDTIEEGVDVEIPGAEKCATPTIAYSKGELTFSCETVGATCKYTITDADIQSGSGNRVELSVAYQVSVVATKEGYNNSETAEATLCWVDVQPQTEGVVVATAVQRTEALPVLIQTNGGVVRITGAPEGSTITVYDVAGQLMGSGKATAGTTDISTLLRAGDVAIVRIGDKSVKVLVK